MNLLIRKRNELSTALAVLAIAVFCGVLSGVIRLGAGSKGGGYMLSTADHFFDAPIENIKAYAEAAKECVY